MNKTRTIGLPLLLATLGLGTAATSSSAAISLGAPPSPGGVFSGITATGANHTFTFGSIVTTCSGATYSNLRGTGSPSATATFRAAFGSCGTDIGGVVCATTVVVPTDWTITPTAYVAGTGTPAGTPGSNTAKYTSSITFGNLANPAPIDVFVNDAACGVTACHFYVAAQGPRTGTLATTDVGTGAVGSAAIRFAGTATTLSYIPVGCGVPPVPTTNSVYTVAPTGILATGAFVYGS